jgi:hypothetical protein
MQEYEVKYLERETRYLDKLVIFRKRIALKLNIGKQFEPFYWFHFSVRSGEGVRVTNKIFDTRLYVIGWYIQFMTATVKED